MAVRWVFALLAVAVGASAEEGRANLLVAKELSNKMIVMEKDVVIKYTVHNVGDAAAHDVLVTDDDILKGPFTIVSGLQKAKYPVIAAGSKASHTLVVTPTKQIRAHHNFSSAQITYKATESTTSVTTGYSSTPGRLQVLPSSAYARSTAPHLMEWALFAVIAFIPLGIPAMFINQAKAKYAVKAKSA